MITTLDRMVLVAFFRSYAIVWSSLISLFVVIDLFTHLDAYMSRPGGFIVIANYIIRYYAYRIPQVFDLLAEPISLMAATFTVAWMQRNNELLPQLSAGIPTRRIIRPILIGSALTLTFAPLNQEFVIPEIADELMTARDDQEGTKAQILLGAFDTSGVHLEGQAGFRRDKRIEQFFAKAYLYTLGIGHVEHPLARCGKAIKPFAVFNGNVVVKCVDIRSADTWLSLGTALLKIPPHAHIAVGYMEQCLVSWKLLFEQPLSFYVHLEKSSHSLERLLLDRSAHHARYDLALEQKHDDQRGDDNHHRRGGDITTQNAELRAKRIDGDGHGLVCLIGV
jgi:hypothetical protein